MNPNLRGAAVMREVPVVRYDEFVASAIKVFVPEEQPDGSMGGSIQVMRFEPVEIDDPCDAVLLIQFLVAQQSPKPGPVDWSTVPSQVQRHFRPMTAEELGQSQAAKKSRILVP